MLIDRILINMRPKVPKTNPSVRPVIVGQFGPPVLACIRSWGEQGFPVGMVCIHSKRETMPDSRYLDNSTTLAPEKLYKTDGIQIINEFLIKFKASGIICINERIACWLNDHSRVFPPDVALWLPPNGTIRDLLSKKRQIEIAREVGLDILPTHLINRDETTLNSIALEDFPLCLRPTEGGTVKPAFKVHLAYSPAELKKYIASRQKIEKPIIAQPFMNLPNLVVHGARTTSGETIGLQAFLVERKFEGVTLTIRPVNLERDLRSKCIEFTNRFNLTGNYHFEFLIDKNSGSVYFLELNSRLGGTTAKVYACGYDEPMLALQAYGIKGKAWGKPQDITVSSKEALLKYLYYTLANRLTPLDFPDEPGPIRMFKTLLGLFWYRDDVFNSGDVKGSISFYLGILRVRFKR